MENDIGTQDRAAAAQNSKRMWIFLAVMLIVLAVAFYAPSTPTSSLADRPLTDAEKCHRLTGPQCFEKLQLERRRREFIESPAGQDMLRAAEATGN